MPAKPVNLSEALASFDDVYSPRIVARMNDYDVRIAHAKGEHVWHVHDDTDEFFHVLSGRIRITDEAGLARIFGPGEACVIPAGFKGVFEVLEPVTKHYVFVKRGEMR